ncbi:hypothetical protein G4B88_017659 [Cannabis sativa]|uniref:Uncharacterized protein n=1 Tax=Cannabis sativa TaxID=3483 RepID=A0A7J6I3L5_CANSA|nr:hypothetical protein G4B88_017659 [Cannabis sativa]
MKICFSSSKNPSSEKPKELNVESRMRRELKLKQKGEYLNASPILVNYKLVAKNDLFCFIGTIIALLILHTRAGFSNYLSKYLAIILSLLPKLLSLPSVLGYKFLFILVIDLSKNNDQIGLINVFHPDIFKKRIIHVNILQNDWTQGSLSSYVSINHKRGFSNLDAQERLIKIKLEEFQIALHKDPSNVELMVVVKEARIEHI